MDTLTRAEELAVDAVIESLVDEAIERKHCCDECADHNKEASYSHYADGFSPRCGAYLGPSIPIRIVLTWDSVTCPACLNLKKSYEPWSRDIDTRGD